MIKKPAEEVSGNALGAFGALFRSRPRDAGRSISDGPMHPQADAPREGQSLAEWMAWGMEESSVSSSFWSLCLVAPDQAWSEAVQVYESRREALFDGDGSMSFGRFAVRAGEAAEAGDSRAIERVAELVSLPAWRLWLMGGAGRMSEMGCASRFDTRIPPMFELHMRALEAGWAPAPALIGADACAAMEAWLRRGEAKESTSGAPSTWLRALVLGGALNEPDGACEPEKLVASMFWKRASPWARAKLWLAVLAEGEPAALALAAKWGPPDAPKEMCLGSTRTESLDEASQVAIGGALALAARLGWVSPKLFDKTIADCKTKKLAAQAAVMEAWTIERSSSPAPTSKTPRI